MIKLYFHLKVKTIDGNIKSFSLSNDGYIDFLEWENKDIGGDKYLGFDVTNMKNSNNYNIHMSGLVHDIKLRDELNKWLDQFGKGVILVDDENGGFDNNRNFIKSMIGSEFKLVDRSDGLYFKVKDQGKEM